MSQMVAVATARKGVRFACCLFVVSLVATAGTELCLRGLVQHPLPIGLLRTHSSRHFELIPGFRGRSYDVELSINSWGMRDYERRPDPNAYRIAIFGDSLAFGQGVRAEQTFPKQVEKSLLQKGAGPIQVFNFATPGHNTVAELSLLQDVQSRVVPDLVIFQYTLSDDSVAMTESSINRFRAIRAVKDILRGLYTYDYLASRYYGLNAPHAAGNDAQTIKDLYADSYGGWQDCQDAFVRVSQFAGAHMFQLMFVVFSYDGHIAPSASEDANVGTLAKLFSALDHAGISEHILMDDSIRTYAGRESQIQVHEGDKHFSAVGHGLLAEFLALEIQKRRRH